MFSSSNNSSNNNHLTSSTSLSTNSSGIAATTAASTVGATSSSSSSSLSSGATLANSSSSPLPQTVTSVREAHSLRPSSPSNNGHSVTSGDSKDEPAFLSVGTEVSAKYKGAFCEAKIKHVTRLVKCRVTLKSSGSSVLVTDENIRGDLKVGAIVDVKHQHNQYQSATITKIMDGSQYTVVFDDGDETTLRRSNICLKSGKHYSESESLDHLPLTNPEHFGNPVRSSGGRGKRSSRTRTSTTPTTITKSGRRSGGRSVIDDDEKEDSDNDDNESNADTATGSIDDDDSASNITQPSTSKDDNTMVSQQSSPKLDGGQGSPNPFGDGDIGRVVIVEYDREKRERNNRAKDFWYPALVVSPTTPESTIVKINDPEIEYLVKSFKDNKFYLVMRKDVKEFDRDVTNNLNDTNSSAALRNAIDKTMSWLDRHELPQSWDRDLLLGPYKSSDDSNEMEAMDEGETGADTSGDGGSGYVDDVPSEEKDRFVVQLMLFMDQRGTPMNRPPIVNGKELDLYRLWIKWEDTTKSRIAIRGNRFTSNAIYRRVQRKTKKTSPSIN